MDTKRQHLERYEASREFVHELRRAIDDAYFDRMTRLIYSTDASIYQMIPVGVAMPRNAEEVSAAIEIAGKHDVPVLPRGGGSSLAGQAVGNALILDLSRYMNEIIEIDPEARRVRTQPGITHHALNQSLLPHGLMYGPDPASGDRATVGGMLANNSTGAHSILYGMTDQHVISTSVVLADGSTALFEAVERKGLASRERRPGLEGAIYRHVADILARYAEPIAERYPRIFRTVAGYNLNLLAKDKAPNLARLIVGSEGTLAVITEATLNLVPIPTLTRLAIVHFDSLRSGLEAVPRILECDPSAIELIDKIMLELTRDKTEYRPLLTFVEGDPQVVLLVEFVGDHEAELDARIKDLRAKLKLINHQGAVLEISDPAQQANVWNTRKAGLGILMSVRGDAKPIPFIEDAAVPVERLADYVTEMQEFALSTGVEWVAMYAHASAGCLHIRPLINLKTVEGMSQIRAIAEKSVELVMRFGGTTSSEHGEGLARGEFSKDLFGSELQQAFQEVKQAFDPQGLMNPGKVVNVPRMDDETLLRFGPRYATPYEPQETVFGFSADQGFAGAVEMCNGSAACRKTGQGVMCPSFQATRNEAYSTRGYANSLRAAMMGLLGPEAMTSKELFDVLDLCLMCQACKSECPSVVDMAKLKAEFLHGYYRKNRMPLRSKLFGNIARLNRLGQPFAPLTNALVGGPIGWLLTRSWIHPDRRLPKLAPQTFSRWFNSREARNGAGRPVVLFHDTFMEHNHPQVGMAAVRVLEAAGYRAILVENRRCCGRPAVSKGLLADARDSAQHNVQLLAPYAREGISIVGCEPSCMTMLAEEYADLVPGEDSRVVSRMVMPLDSFLVQEHQAGRLGGLEFDGASREVLFHGHCQQKAVFGTKTTHDMLKLVPHCTVEQVESGCCGMAGSWGYEAEHYDLSIRLAELALAPAVRSAPTGAIICATGVSCRDQIAHTTGRQAVHPIEVLADALVTG